MLDSLWNLYSKLALPGKLWVLPVNFVFALLGKKVRAGFDSGLGLFTVHEGPNRILLSRRKRLRLFHRGLDGRLEFLVRSYGVSELKVDQGDIVIDCGANIGEFSVYMQKKGAIVHAFEPNPTEFKVLQSNLAKLPGSAWPFGCSSKSGLGYLSGNNDEGDSSVVYEVPLTGKAEQISTVSLDDWASANLRSTDDVKLIKLEAEGAELEVLLGAESLLGRTHFICADLGESDGASGNAVGPVTNFLFSKGFTIYSFSKYRCMTVFRNDSF